MEYSGALRTMDRWCRRSVLIDTVTPSRLRPSRPPEVDLEMPGTAMVGAAGEAEEPPGSCAVRRTRSSSVLRNGRRNFLLRAAIHVLQVLRDEGKGE